MEWMRRNLREPHSLGSLAEQAALSPRTLQRQFLDAPGLSPIDWVLRERVAFARELLETTDRPLQWIAEHAGFGSQESFRRHFRSQVDASPTEYRSQHRSGIGADRLGHAPHCRWNGDERQPLQDLPRRNRRFAGVGRAHRHALAHRGGHSQPGLGCRGAGHHRTLGRLAIAVGARAGLAALHGAAARARSRPRPCVDVRADRRGHAHHSPVAVPAAHVVHRGRRVA
ncbi:hypothetical protein G6F59_014141 [Rhizopus arrhizus]|nr:hypothetical protein G6F59_014141 [Rhizopus arrhizus]